MRRASLHPGTETSLGKREEEEVYIQALSSPVRIPRNNPGLRILQQMRDEAHRFAQHYHHMRRRERVWGKAGEDNSTPT